MEVELSIMATLCDRRIGFAEPLIADDGAGQDLDEEGSPQSMRLEDIHDEWESVRLRARSTQNRQLGPDRRAGRVVPCATHGAFGVDGQINVKHGHSETC